MGRLFIGKSLIVPNQISFDGRDLRGFKNPVGLQKKITRQNLFGQVVDPKCSAGIGKYLPFQANLAIRRE
jgi:hypothetical protein